ncbi:MAG TPA: hypothetical protein VKV95_07845 [Terriglobia bacterium]|nr:hypothetical protein [Terriglobia bacterium]
MPTPTSQGPVRRSRRVQVRIPITLTGTLADGKTFNEETFVVTVSKFGGKIKTAQPLTAGSRVKIQPKGKKESDLVRVAWVGHAGTSRAGEIGIEYTKLSNILGVTFPE